MGATPSPIGLPSSAEEGPRICAGVVRPGCFSSATQKLSTEECSTWDVTMWRLVGLPLSAAAMAVWLPGRAAV